MKPLLLDAPLAWRALRDLLDRAEAVPVGIRRDDGQGFVLVPVQRWKEGLALRNRYAERQIYLNLQDVVMDLVCEATYCSRELIQERTRRSESLLPRLIAMTLLRENGLSFSAIGNYFSLHHSTVINGIVSLNNRMSKDPGLRHLVENLRRDLGRIPTQTGPGFMIGLSARGLGCSKSDLE